MDSNKKSGWRGRRDFLTGGATLLAISSAPQLVGAAPSMARRIDVHSHFLPEKYRAALAAAGQSKPAGMPGIPAWSVDQHIAMMDRNGIEASIISISAPGLHFGDDAAARALARYCNDEGAKAAQAHPKRFGMFAALPLPDIDGSLKELDYAFDTLHADGVVIESNHNGLYLGDKRLDPVFQRLDSRKAKLFIHPTSPYCPGCTPNSLEPLGYPFPMVEFMFETTRAVFNLILSGTLTKYPNIKIIVPHAGATIPVLADRVAGLSPALGLPTKLDVPRFYEALRGLYYDLAGFPIPRQILPLLEIADPSHLFYGSDWPYTPEILVTELARQLDSTPLLNDAMRQAVMRGNAAALFPRFA